MGVLFHFFGNGFQLAFFAFRSYRGIFSLEKSTEKLITDLKIRYPGK
jgi:hypothetical protein